MHIRDWPIAERPREKLLGRGAAALSDAELLAIFLGSGLPGMDAVATARQILVQRSLREVLECAPRELATFPGIGPARASLLTAALELGRRRSAAELERGHLLKDAAAAARYFAQRLQGRTREVFAVLFLDNRHRALGFEELFHGTVNRSAVYPREVVRRALVHNAAAVIVGHNHPSGDPEPSTSDQAITCTLKQSLALIEVRLLDHVVVGDGAPVSMAERGLL